MIKPLFSVPGFTKNKGKCHKILILTIPLWILWQKLERGRENNVNKTLITHYLQKMLSFNGEERFFLRNFFKVFTKKWTFWFFSENFSYSVHLKLLVFLCEILVEKLIKNHFFEDFETKKLLEKFSENAFLIWLKIHQKMQKIFQNVFSSLLLSFLKLKYSS